MLTGISLAYFFLMVSIVAIAAYLYFKLLIIKSAPDSDKRDEIIGNMKDPENWIERNRRMSHICLFWFAVSILLFITFKFFYGISLVPIIYLIIYSLLVLLSVIIYPGIRKKASF